MMLISYERSFLFVHVPKTGGTSVRSVLMKYRHDPLQYRTNRVLSRFGIGVNYLSRDFRKLRFRNHERLQRVADLLPEILFERLFKFAFVRNPWDLLSSMYKYIQKTPKHKRYRKVGKMTFSEFLDFAIEKQIAHQHRLITDHRGRILVDFVGRFEFFQIDFASTMKRLEIAESIPHLNKTSTSNYQDLYDRHSRVKVANAYRIDIDLFQYEFDRQKIAA